VTGLPAPMPADEFRAGPASSTSASRSRPRRRISARTTSPARPTPGRARRASTRRPPAACGSSTGTRTSSRAARGSTSGRSP
jgi:hypothetical protein